MTGSEQQIHKILKAGQFKYYPPKPLNNIVFLVLTLLFLVFLEKYGQASWSWVIAHMSVAFFFVAGGFLFYLLVFWAVGIPYLLLDKYRQPQWLYEYKIQDIPDDRRAKMRQVPLKKSVLKVLSNQFLGTLPYLVLVYFLLDKMGYAHHISIPVWWVVLLQLLGLILIEDILFFMAHYFMHRPYLFKRVHRTHHEYRESVAIATHYVHYLEHIIGNLTPVFAGVLILQPHPFVVLFWIFMVVINALHTHSGYAIPWMSYSVHHDWHHYYVNGSFSAVGLMDRIFGTDDAFIKMQQANKPDKI